MTDMKQTKKFKLTGVLVLLVFAVFLVCVLMVLLTGADIVQKLTRRDRESYLHRTAVQYVAMRVRQADQSGMVEVRREDGQDVLILGEIIDGRQYETRVYYHDGFLREMFCEAGAKIPPEFGEEILAMDGFSAQKQDSALTLQIRMEDGSGEDMILCLRSGGEDAP